MDAPALEFAEDAVREVIGELLERSELLAEWRGEKCEVELHPQLTQQSFDAAEGPDAPPADPMERTARHAEAASATVSAGLSGAEVEKRRFQIRPLAPGSKHSGSNPSATALMTKKGPKLSCVAEELVLRLLLAEAEVALDTYGLLDDGVKAAWEAFVHEVYEDSDHEWQ
ncbi:hypothetical protein [Streptomyces sp. S186]|uniref:hypothetical protein n=1 Tax=Streptomyces sp. S186 TaxID=3434395 RepID=UPI003F6777B6